MISKARGREGGLATALHRSPHLHRCLECHSTWPGEATLTDPEIPSLDYRAVIQSLRRD